MKIALAVPALAGALFAGSALADPRDALQPNHSEHGSIVRTTWTTGAAPQSIKGRDTDVKFFVDHLSAHQKAGIAKSNEAEREKQKANGKPEKKPQTIAHPKGGDQTAESTSGVASHCDAMHRCNKDGERLHLSGAQMQQLSGGAEKPADMGASGKSGKAPSGAESGQGGASNPGEKVAVAHHETEKFKAPVQLQGEAKPDTGDSDSRASHNAAEARAERFVSNHEPGSMAAHHVERDQQMRMPSKFFR